MKEFLIDPNKQMREEKALEEHNWLSKFLNQNRFMFEMKRRQQMEELIKSAPVEYQERFK